MKLQIYLITAASFLFALPLIGLQAQVREVYSLEKGEVVPRAAGRIHLSLLSPARLPGRRIPSYAD